MTKTPADSMIDLAKLAGQAIDVMIEQEVQALHLVQAEMDALGDLILTPAKSADPRLSEAEIEAGFDNMPV